MNAATPNGVTALHVASFAGDDPHIVEVRRKLDFSSNTATDWSSYLPNASLTLQALLDSGARIGDKDENGTTALHHASSYGHNKVLEVDWSH